MDSTERLVGDTSPLCDDEYEQFSFAPSKSFLSRRLVNNFLITFGRVMNDPGYIHRRFGSRVVDMNVNFVRPRFTLLGR